MRKFSGYTAPIAALTTLVIDQLIKKTLVKSGVFWSLPPFSIGVHYNEGIAFSLPFPKGLLVLLTLVILAIFLLYWFRQKPKTVIASLGTGLFVGGALSNLVDRVRLGAVVDYLNVFTATINLADLAILAGIAILLFSTETKVAKH